MTQSAQLFQFPSQDGQKEALDKAFEEVWKNYGNKAKKPLAKAKFLAIVKGGFKTRTLDKDSGSYVDIELEATADEILQGVKRYMVSQIDRKTYTIKDGGKFIPHLSTFLNQGRWMDE